MKAIILGAGQGTRLRPLTENIPKCMVPICGNPLLAYQLAAFNLFGINDLHVVTGYKGEAIKFGNLTKHKNERFEHTNMVYSLFCAAAIMDGDDDLIISYGDIVFEPSVLQSLVECRSPVGVVVDENWLPYWQARMEDPLCDAETLKLNAGKWIVELGKKPETFNDIDGQYVGLIKISAAYVISFKKFWYDLVAEMENDQSAVVNIYMTSFIQLLIDAGWPVEAVKINNGWAEVDTPNDLQLASRFCELDYFAQT